MENKLAINEDIADIDNIRLNALKDICLLYK